MMRKDSTYKMEVFAGDGPARPVDSPHGPRVMWGGFKWFGGSKRGTLPRVISCGLRAGPRGPSHFANLCSIEEVLDLIEGSQLWLEKEIGRGDFGPSNFVSVSI